MLTSEILKYYADLLIIQYRSKPKARAQVEAIVTMMLMDQLPAAVMNGFNIDTAVGAQLDVVAKYVGANRIGLTDSGLITLTDEEFRKLIKLCIIKNTSTSSLYDIQNLLAIYFPNQIFVKDNAEMQLSYYLDSSLGSSDFLEVVVNGNYLPKPSGVAITAFVAVTDNYFGFRTYALEASGVAPFNAYAFYQLAYPWLSYQDVI